MVSEVRHHLIENMCELSTSDQTAVQIFGYDSCYKDTHLCIDSPFIAGILNSETLTAHCTVHCSLNIADTVRLDCIVPENGIVTVVMPIILCQDDQVLVHPLPTPGGYQYQHNGTEHLYQPVQSLTLDPL